MSIYGLLDAMRSDYAPATRLVWQCLENHANDDRWWAMTHEQIMAELHLSRDSVDRAVATLARGNIIQVERFKRKVSVFHMLRTYPEAGSGGQPHYSNGHVPEPELMPEIQVSNAELMPGIQVSNAQPHEYLTPDFAPSTVELTPEIQVSTVELTPEIQAPESTSKNPPEKTPPTHRAGAATAAAEAAAEVSVCVGNFDFEMFWSCYPKKVKRGRARAAWEVAITRAPASTIVAGVQQFVWPQETRWIPDPHNWLAAEQWWDEVSSYDDDILRAAGLDPRDYRGGPPIDGDAVRSPARVLQCPAASGWPCWQS